MNREQEYMDKLLVHYNYAQEHCPYPIFGVFLVGSQNYGLDDEQSDVDAYAMYIQKPRERLRWPLPHFQYLPEKGQTTGISFYHWLGALKKQTFPKDCFECLITDYVIINPLFQEEWDQIQNIKSYLFSKYSANFHYGMFQEYQGLLERATYNKKLAVHCKRFQLIFEQGSPQFSPVELLKMTFLSEEERRNLIDQRRGRQPIDTDELISHCLCPHKDFVLTKPTSQQDKFLDAQKEQIWNSVLNKLENNGKKELME